MLMIQKDELIRYGNGHSFIWCVAQSFSDAANPNPARSTTMNQHDLTPNAAERYFDSSPFGQLYTSMAAALGQRARPGRRPRRSATTAPSAYAPSVLERLERWFW